MKQTSLVVVSLYRFFGVCFMFMIVYYLFNGSESVQVFLCLFHVYDSVLFYLVVVNLYRFFSVCFMFMIVYYFI
jgi:hypothetical protein